MKTEKAVVRKKKSSVRKTKITASKRQYWLRHARAMQILDDIVKSEIESVRAVNNRMLQRAQ
ncbi:MAG TPA: hypothetical protein VIN08_20715 [Ohtaekwangia sp.]|uniref:hypothetical protein n=1 Tax=Ohtaekwangia sp. TaxID=2066019 RepID=UPI002F943D4E